MMSDIEILVEEQMLIERAAIMCVSAHGAIGQKRKYTHEPYWFHPQRVAGLVKAVEPNDHMMIAAAYLHDVVEDTALTIEDISEHVGESVASIVDELTNKATPEDGNRAQRKAIEQKRLGNASRQAQTIKVADMLDNVPSVIQHDPEFAKVYVNEKRLMMILLTEADQYLRWRMLRIIDQYYEKSDRLKF